MAEATKERAGGKKLAQKLRVETGENLRKLREAKGGMSQSALAESLLKSDGQPWHFTYVGNIERGTTSPSQAFVRAAAEFFEVTPEDILADGVALDDLSEGVIRAPRNGRKRRQRQPQDTQSEAATPRRAASNGTSSDPIGLSLENGALKIVTGKMTLTVEGEFDAQVVNGRLRLAS